MAELRRRYTQQGNIMYGDLTDREIAAAIRRAEELTAEHDPRRLANSAQFWLECELGRYLNGGEIQLVAEAAGQVWR